MRRPRGRVRLDRELVRRGLVASRQAAQEVIAAGLVTVDGAPGRKPATQVSTHQQIVVTGPARRWVSRGGDKLDGALDRFDLAVTGRECLDVGASTGGFTDVLLARGAARVVAVDVGYGQLAWRLRTDERVVVVERTHVRDLTVDHLAGSQPDLVVADLSFISLRTALPPLRTLLGAGVDWCCLAKPQFEVGRDHVGRGGVVQDPDAWGRALDAVRDAAANLDLTVAGATVSDLPGPAGNIEFFVWLRDRSRSGDRAPGTGDGDPVDWAPLRDALLAQGTALRARTNG
ncbi:MAG TPA: TlyA family RNA methyltransferase [Euzebyales bacterium]|nr:TlyA family RNA methyltransferase [Euzebyales bacterium]